MAGVVERRGWTERVWIQSKGTRGGTKWGEGVLERRFGCAGGVESLRGGGPDSHKPHEFVAGLRNFGRSEASTDVSGTALNCKRCPDMPIRTSLMICVGVALMTDQLPFCE